MCKCFGHFGEMSFINKSHFYLYMKLIRFSPHLGPPHTLYRVFTSLIHRDEFMEDTDTEQGPVGLLGTKAFLCPPFLDNRK